MAGALKVSIALRGFKETARLLKTEELAGPPWRSFMEQIGQLGADSIRAGAPMRSGLTVNRTGHKVQRTPLPRYTIMRTAATRKGYPYPRLTTFSPYAQSRYKKGTNPNKGWFERAIDRVEHGIAAFAQRTVDEIARRWGAG